MTANLPLRSDQITDGLSTTLMIAEKLHPESSWLNGTAKHCARRTFHQTIVPISIPRNRGHAASPGYLGGFASQHPSGINATFADGSLRFITDHIDLSLYRGYATRNGNELVRSP